MSTVSLRRLLVRQACVTHNMKRGYITLISVMVVGAVGVALTTSLILLGLGSSRTSFAVEQSNQAKGLADACADEALQQIRDLTSYSGTGGFSLGQGTCTYNVTNTGGQTRTVTSVGTVGTIVRKASVLVNAINPQILLTSWQEVAN